MRRFLLCDLPAVGIGECAAGSLHLKLCRFSHERRHIGGLTYKDQRFLTQPNDKAIAGGLCLLVVLSGNLHRHLGGVGGARQSCHRQRDRVRASVHNLLRNT